MKTPFQLSQSHCVKITWTKCPCSHPDTLQSGRGPMHLLIFPNTEAGFISFEQYYELFHKYTKKRWHFRWIQGSIDPRFDGSKSRWIQGSIDPRFDGSKGRWIQGSIGPRFDGSKGRYGFKAGPLQLSRPGCSFFSLVPALVLCGIQPPSG